MGVERRRRKQKKRKKHLPLFSGTESVRAWVGRVAEQAKQAPGMLSVGVRMGWEGWGMKPKWQSGSHCVWELVPSLYVCVYAL